MARLNTLVPNGDELVDEDHVAATTPIVMPQRMSEGVLAVMRTKPEADWHVEDVAKALEGRNPPTVRSTMARMAAPGGPLERTSHGRYRISGATQTHLVDATPASTTGAPGGEEVKKEDV